MYDPTVQSEKARVDPLFFRALKERGHWRWVAITIAVLNYLH